jgi:small conductance mechanosensitive channel
MAEPTAPSTPGPAAPAPIDRLVDGLDELARHVAAMSAEEITTSIALSLAIAFGAALGVWLLGRALDRLLARPGLADDAKGKARVAEATRLTWTILRLVAAVAAGVAILGVWGLDALSLLGADLGGRLARLVVVMVITIGLIELSGLAIDRTVGGFARRSDEARKAAQLRTLRPLLKGFAQIAILITGVLTLMTELGVNVGPVLASAGVLGIALGFGAQTLVKDFLTGLFLVAEDVVSVGDNVRIGTSAGVVEAMTLRTIRLRDVDATLHIFPYSEAQVIHNRSKDFSAYLVEAPISYDTDVDKALAVIRQVGEAMAADPAYAARINRPFEVLGVDRLTDNAIQLKARITTRPRDQWEVGREFNRRLLNAFEAEGIRTPVKTAPVQAQALGPTVESAK